jgi:putative redox protein
MTRAIVVTAGEVKYVQDVTVGPHLLHADEPEAAGGRDIGPSPYELLLAALGTCTAITVQMFADRRQWPLRNVQVRLSHARSHADDCAQCDTSPAKLDRIDLAITLSGDLSEDQRRRLLAVAGRCPVHNTLSAPILITLREWDDC